MSTLTRVLINPATRGGRRLLTQPQAMHAAVRAAFPPDIASDGRVLWRVDQHEHQHTLFIVGPEEPDRSVITDQAGWPSRPGDTADYSRFLSQLRTGQEWVFRLTANPVRSLPANGGKRGKVVPHVTPEQQLAWLDGVAERHGFRVLQGAVTRRRDLSFTKSRGGPRVTLRTAQFDGSLQVTDPEELRRTLAQGIGRGRAYGCGLLTLARAQG